MTGGAQQRGVVRHRLLPRDLAMTGAAFAGRHRGFRLVRVVTVHTRGQRVVRNRIDLRKAGGAGWVVSVAAYAEFPRPWDRRLTFNRIGHVGRSRTVTRLTGHPTVVGSQTPLGDVTVAQCALLLPSILLGMAQDRVDGRRTVMAHLSKGLGNEQAPGDHECKRGEGERGRETGYLLWHLADPVYRWDSHWRTLSAERCRLDYCGQPSGARLIPT